MIRIHERREIPLRREQAFAYVADFANVAEWDPGVLSSARQGDQPPVLGTRYDVVVTFGRSTLDLVYEITEWDTPSRAVLVTSSRRFGAVDTITFVERDENRTSVDYVADFTLKGVMRLLTPFVRPMFKRLVQDALDGLVRTLAERPPA